MPLAKPDLSTVPVRVFMVDRDPAGGWHVLLELVGCRPVQSKITDCRPETIKLVYELCYKVATDHLGRVLHEIPTIQQSPH